MNQRLRWWLIAGAVSISAAAIAVAINDESPVTGALSVLVLVWIVASLWLVLWRVWRWMTYRVGVRLFISYLLVGLLPILFGVAFTAVGLYIMMGQYTSVRFGSEMKRLRSELEAECHAVLDRVRTQGADEAAALLEELAATNPDPLPQVVWQARLGGQNLRLGGGAELPEIDRRLVKLLDHDIRITLAWDADKEQITNRPELNELLHYEYRKPWVLR